MTAVALRRRPRLLPALAAVTAAVLLMSARARAVGARFKEESAWQGSKGMNLGPTGIGARLMSKSFIVMHVSNGSPAQGRVKVGDEIVGVNGSSFVTPHTFGFGWDEAAKHGYKGPMMDFGNAIEDSEGSDGILKLMVKRGGKVTEVPLQLRRLGRFSDTFPLNCEKSDRIYREICEFLASTQKGGGWDRRITNVVAGLTLLGSGEAKYLPNVKRVAHGMLDIKPTGEGLYNWGLTYTGIFLGEYFLATRDTKVLDAIGRVSRGLAFNMSADYSFCHGKLFPSHSAYPELGIMNGQAAMAWGLARSCGVEVDEHKYRMLLKRLRFHTRPDGHVSYARPSYPEWYKDKPRPFVERSRGGEGVGRGGAAALGYYLSDLQTPEAAEYIRHVCKYLTEYKEYFPDTHACPEVGIQWMGLALASGYPEGFRQVMDYHKAWFNLARTFEPGQFACMPCRSDAWDKNWSRAWMSGTVGLLFSVKERRLRMAGARVYLVGVNPTKLSRYTKAAYDLIGSGDLARASRVLTRFESKIAANEKDKAYAKCMTEHITGRVEEVLKELIGLATSPDVIALKTRLESEKKNYGGIDLFDERAAPIEASLRREPRKTALKIGRQYMRLLTKAEKSKSKLSIRALERFAKGREETYYGSAALSAAARLAGKEGKPMPDPKAYRLTPPEVVAKPVGKMVSNSVTGGPTAEGRARFDRQLQARVAAVVKSGGKPKYFSSRMRTLFRITAIDAAHTLTARGLRIPVTMRFKWARISDKDLGSIALSVLRQGNPKDHAVAAFYLLAAGDKKKGTVHLLLAGEDAGVLDAFGDK